MEIENDTKAMRAVTRRSILQLAGASALIPSAAFAQSYPTAPVTVTIPLPPGGVVDVLGRGCGEKFRKDTGQPFVIENVAGATGMIGCTRVARGKPDGSAALLTISSPIVTSVFMIKNMPFDPDKDLEPVILAAQTVDALVVHSSVPVNSLQEYIAYAKAHPGEMAFGTPGVGSPHHICGVFLQSLTGIQLTHIPYKGSNEATADLIAGHVPSGIVALGGVTAQAKAGNVKILAITDDKRIPEVADIPTVGEIVPGFAHAPAPWTGMFVPAKTPKPIIDTLNHEMNLALSDPEFSAVLKEIFMFPVGGAPEVVTEKIRYERDITKSLLGQLGIVPE
jgi:tripartite-type tricarboxylate transporter receptor subunit TctC